MALSFTLIREIDVSGGFVADANPNITNPSAGGVFVPSTSVTGQSSDYATRGISLYIRAVKSDTTEVPTTTVDFTAWGKDLGASSLRPGPAGISRWAALKAESAAPSSGVYTTTYLGDMFVQLTAASLGSGTSKLQIWVTPRTL